jgi:shikimate kinase
LIGIISSMFSFIAVTPHFLDLDALHGFTRRQHENLAEFSEEKGEQLFRNAPVFALQDFLLMSVPVGDIDFTFVFQSS